FRAANLASFHAPDEVLRLVRSANYEKPGTRDQCLYVVASSMDKKAKWEPEIIASEIVGTYRKYVFSSLNYYEKDSARKYELLSRMALEAREEEDDASKMYALANLAESAADDGFVAEAGALAEEAQQIAERLPKTVMNENGWYAIANAWSLVDAKKVQA